jgi:mannosyltransferase
MITFDGIIFTSRSHSGGVSVYFRQMFKHAVASSSDVRMIVHGPNLRAEEFGCEPQQLLYRRPRLGERYRSLRGVSQGVLHSSYYRVTPQRGVRNVVTVYDFTYERYWSGLRVLVHGAHKRRAIARADAVICISENTRRDLHEYLPDCDMKKVFVTHLAANEEFLPVETAAAERPFVLFVGSRLGYKNFPDAVAATALTRECVLVTAGGGELTAAERELLNRALPGRHQHHGAVSTQELNLLYNSAICLLYPSAYEGFGIPPLEAMQAGCPFVALARSSIPEVAGTAGILLDTTDARVIADAIESSASPSRRAELRRLGFEQARKFSWRRTFDQTSAIYRTLLA